MYVTEHTCMFRPEYYRYYFLFHISAVFVVFSTFKRVAVMRQFTELQISNCQRAQHLPIEQTDLETNLVTYYFVIHNNFETIKLYSFKL